MGTRGQTQAGTGRYGLGGGGDGEEAAPLVTQSSMYSSRLSLPNFALLAFDMMTWEICALAREAMASS